MPKETLLNRALSFFRRTPKAEESLVITPAPRLDKSSLPAGDRSSEPPKNGISGYSSLNRDAEIVYPGYQAEVIPFIRKLTIANADVSQALHNIVHLGNTGHTIKFDTGVGDDLADKMRNHLDLVSEEWVDGTTGIHGLVNKLFRQVMIGGANSFEAVPNVTLTGLHKVLLVNPESIRFKYYPSTIKYKPFQYAEAGFKNSTGFDNLKALNPNTYRYYSLNGDTESPYGNPPYLPGLGPIEDQKVMLDNIKYIIRQVGVVGFLELLMAKPEMKDGENEAKYRQRCEAFLVDAKNRVTESMRDGIMVGYEEDHTFQFQSVTKNLSGVEQLFGINETQVASGLKSDPGLMGKGSKGAESHITIIFTKLIAELNNIQINVAKCLEFIYAMELRLAGYNFTKLTVKFNPSTVQDELKLQQATEIKIRNLKAMYDDGIISQEQYAEAMGYEKPALAKPRIERSIKGQAGGEDPSAAAVKKKKREEGKDASDRKSRAKDKPQDRKAYK